jgi:hypothetical protein
MVSTQEWVEGAEPEETVDDAAEETVDEVEETEEVEEEVEDEEDDDDSDDGDDESDDEEEEDGEEEDSDEKDEEPEERTFKLKVNGREVELTEDEIQQWASKGMGSEEKFREAAQTRDAIVKLFNQIKEGGTDEKAKLLKQIGVNIDEFAEDYLYEKIQRENMPEEQRKLLEAQDEIKKLKATQEEEKKQAEAAKQQQEQQYWQERYDKEISDAITSNNLPATAGNIAMVAKYMEQGLIADQEQGLQAGTSVSVEDAVLLVKDDLKNNVNSNLKDADEDALIELLGEEKLRKLQEKYIKSLKSPSKLNKVNPGDKQKGVKKKQNKKRTWEEIKQDIYNSIES